MKKLFTALLSCLLVFAACFSVPAVLAETADNTITAMHLAEWYTDAGVEHKVAVEAGKTYTFTAFWKHLKHDSAGLKLYGSAVGGTDKKLVIAKEAQENVTYDLSTGKLSYTFTASGTELTIQAFMGGAGQTDLYFAKPELFESDENGNKIENGAVIDCDPNFVTSWSHWGYGGNYRNVEQVASDFFANEDLNHPLISLNVGYPLSPSFDRRTHEYSVSVPNSVTSLNLEYELAEGAEAAISGNENFEVDTPKDVMLVITNGGVTSKYIITVARNAAETITAMHLAEWYTDAGVEHKVAVEAGKTYTFTAFWKHLKHDSAGLKLYGSAVGGTDKKLVIAKEAQENVTYDLSTGKLSYTFTASGTELTIQAFMGGAGQTDLYFAKPELFESDENGNKIENGAVIDCDLNFVTSWSHWSYGGNYRNVEQVRSNFFCNIRGDVDDNGTIEATDLAMLRKILLGVEACQNEYTANANGDSDIDLRDLICLKKNLLA